MASFYAGGAQQLPQYLANGSEGTVAFVYKDGVYPGEHRGTGAGNMLRIAEANEPERAEVAGVRLASIQRAMRTEQELSLAEQIAIGHSWGLTNITASELAGAVYDKVISLSGAGMLAEWRPDPRTSYTDFSYEDILHRAQRTGSVWDGNYPRRSPAFQHGDYYRGPDDAVLDDDEFTADDVEVLMDNHNLIATTADDNKQVLRDLAKELSR